MIVSGYAFHKKDNASIQVIQLNAPFHALVLSLNGDVQETTMDDIELDIVKNYWSKNKKYLEDAYA
ncbi:MAG: toxin-antitoxin system, toxin component [Paludibacteraceae bacterium]|nr:toxin-antitoxin system, toxin component [Paludibacteraceae bacterium]